MVPVAVAGVAAATIGLVPALAASGDPDLPKITAQQLIEKIAASDSQQLSGTVKITTDLGLPTCGGLAGGCLRRRRASDRRAKAARPPSPDGQADGAGVRHAHAAGRGRRPGQAEAVDPGERRRVQHDPQRQRRLGATTAQSNEVFHSKAAAKGRGQGRRRGARGPERPAEPRRRSSPKRRSKAVGRHHLGDRRRHRPGRRPGRLPAADQAQAERLDGRLDHASRWTRRTGVPLKFTLTPSERRQGRRRRGLHQGRLRASPPPPPSTSPRPRARRSPRRTSWRAREGRHREQGPEGLGRAAQAAGGPRHGFQGLNVIGEGWTTIAELRQPRRRGRRRSDSGDAAPDGLAASSDASATRSRASSAPARSSRPAWSTP